MLSLMEKEEAEAKEKTTEKNRGRVHLQRQGSKKRSKKCKGGREHKKNRDRAIKREVETANTEVEIK